MKPTTVFTIPSKKLKSGFEMPVFGLGTWQMGGRETQDPQNDDKRDITAIQKAIELGITHIDTAEGYANGYAEIILANAIKDFDRSKLLLTTKVSPKHLRYEDVLRSCEASLKRLQTDYLDLYLIHSPNMEIPIEETLRAMDKLVKDGLVKNIGVSNFKTSRLEEAQKHTENKLEVNQVYYNLLMREPEHEGLLKYCQQNDVLLEAYRPLEKGLLVNHFILEKLAKKYDKTPTQIAINWLISQKNVITLSKNFNYRAPRGKSWSNRVADGWGRYRKFEKRFSRSGSCSREITIKVSLSKIGSEIVASK